MLTNAQVTSIAKIAHLAYLEYASSIEEPCHVWEDLPQHTRESIEDGVRAIASDPTYTAKRSHDNWLRFQLNHGWRFGVKKDHIEKTHPCLVNFEDLPASQQIKDHVFVAAVKSCIHML